MKNMKMCCYMYIDSWAGDGPHPLAATKVCGGLPKLYLCAEWGRGGGGVPVSLLSSDDLCILEEKLQSCPLFGIWSHFPYSSFRDAK